MDSVQFSSVAQSCPTLCYPMNRSTPGLPVHHQLPEFTQTHVHWVGDAIQPFHPLSSPSSPAPNPSQHQGLFPMSQLFTNQRQWTNNPKSSNCPNSSLWGQEKSWIGNLKRGIWTFQPLYDLGANHTAIKSSFFLSLIMITNLASLTSDLMKVNNILCRHNPLGAQRVGHDWATHTHMVDVRENKVCMIFLYNPESTLQILRHLLGFC